MLSFCDTETYTHLRKTFLFFVRCSCFSFSNFATVSSVNIPFITVSLEKLHADPESWRVYYGSHFSSEYIPCALAHGEFSVAR